MSCRTAGLDHIMLGVPNLDEGIASFTAATGVVPMRGGKHPGRGTENALVSLGNGSYLEIIAPQQGAAVDWLRALKKPTVVGWAIHVKDAARARALLQHRGIAVTELQRGSRHTPAGETLTWTTFGIESSKSDAMPFVIEWSAATRHPSTTSPAGCTLETFEVGDRDAAAIARVLDALKVNVTARVAEKTNMIATLRCGKRSVEFTTE